MAAMAGLYRRALSSPPAIDFASKEGKELFIEAIQNGTMEGPWRWFDESMLDCCEPLEKVKAEGISFGKLVCLAHCAGAKVEAFRTNHTTLEDFRNQLIACVTSDTCHVISSYHRGIFKQVFVFNLFHTFSRFMRISRPHREPGTLFTLSCKHENWVGIARYLTDDVPFLMKSDDITNIEKVLSVIFTSLPSNFGDFIKWIVEVRRQEDGGPSLSQEEKSRLAVKEEVLEQIQQSNLYSHVTSFLLSANSCCRKIPTIFDKEKLPEIAANVCCQGAEIFGGKSVSVNGYCCLGTSMKSLKTNGDSNGIMLVSGTVVDGQSEQGLDLLVPPSQIKSICDCGPNNCMAMYPAGDDVLTALLLALPPETWSGIKDEKLLQEVYSLVSTDSLPTLLQEEVLHLRRQLHLLKKCHENKVEEDFGVPLY
ncbi:hypothetical protein ACFE04_013629 [Oxalis oulophora]